LTYYIIFILLVSSAFDAFFKLIHITVMNTSSRLLVSVNDTGTEIDPEYCQSFS